jgi:glucokinase
MLLVADIGGTKTDLAIFTEESGPHAPLAEARLPSAEHASPEALVSAFLAEARQPVTRAVFAVAGPVVDGRARTTNLPWVLDEAALARALGLRTVRLMNDLVAVAHAVPLLRPRDLETLAAGTPEAGGALAVVAPGTGLGQAYLTREGARYRAHPSEGGHTDFAPRGALQRELQVWMERVHGHVSYEWVCSGMAVPSLYAFLRERGHAPQSPALAARLSGAQDQTPLITEAAFAQAPDALALAALQLMADILGAQAGNLALSTLATGGVFLGGGMSPRLLPLLRTPRFLEAFRAKGRFEPFMQRVPLHVILHPRAALLGVASAGLA